jgi:hypothetical protein
MRNKKGLINQEALIDDLQRQLDYLRLHKSLGCPTCRFVDLSKVCVGPCCTYAHGPAIENGKCVTRGLFAHA